MVESQKLDKPRDGLIRQELISYERKNGKIYRKEEIREYFKDILHDIEKHYYQDIGGFSYFLNKSQTHYYGIQTTKGLDEPDIHGTTLLVWGLSMIFSTLGDSYPKWNVIKP